MRLLLLAILFVSAQDSEQQERDRSAYVLPAAEDFKPRAQGRRAELRLIVRDNRMWPRGFQVRVELQNVGTEPLHYGEINSFFKTCGFADIMRIEVVDSKGAPVENVPLHSDSVAETIKWPGGLTEQEKKDAFERFKNLRRNQLMVTLQPGETLRTLRRPHRTFSEKMSLFLRGLDPYAPAESFTDWCDYSQNLRLRTGETYRLRAVFNNTPPSPPDEKELADLEKHGLSRTDVLESRRKAGELALGRLDSDWVTVTAVP